MFSPIRVSRSNWAIDSLFRKMVFRVVVYPDYSETKGRMESVKERNVVKERGRRRVGQGIRLTQRSV